MQPICVAGKNFKKISLFYDFLVGIHEFLSFKVYDRCFTAFNSNELRFFANFPLKRIL